MRAAGWPRRVSEGTVLEGGKSGVNLEPGAVQHIVAAIAVRFAQSLFFGCNVRMRQNSLLGGSLRAYAITLWAG